MLWDLFRAHRPHTKRGVESFRPTLETLESRCLMNAAPIVVPPPAMNIFQLASQTIQKVMTAETQAQSNIFQIASQTFQKVMSSEAQGQPNPLEQILALNANGEYQTLAQLQNQLANQFKAPNAVLASVEKTVTQDIDEEEQTVAKVQDELSSGSYDPQVIRPLSLLLEDAQQQLAKGYSTAFFDDLAPIPAGSALDSDFFALIANAEQEFGAEFSAVERQLGAEFSFVVGTIDKILAGFPGATHASTPTPTPTPTPAPTPPATIAGTYVGTPALSRWTTCGASPSIV